MTYQEKYEELFNSYDKATKALNNATQKIAFMNGFGDTAELGNYLKSHKEFKCAEGNFQELLKYVTTENLNPASEYLHEVYMYNSIKQSQQKKGIIWKDDQSAPSTQSYQCTIGLTNDGEVNSMIQGTEYKFPVINLYHGKECYNYLTKRLQNNTDDEFDANDLEFTKIDETKQIFIQVVIITWR